jgi:hypothetical protein
MHTNTNLLLDLCILLGLFDRVLINGLKSMNLSNTLLVTRAKITRICFKGETSAVLLSVAKQGFKRLCYN